MPDDGCRSRYPEADEVRALDIDCCEQKSSRRPAVPGLIANVTLDYVYQGVHPLGEFGHCFVQPFQVPVAPFCALLEPPQALVSPFGKQPGAFRELPDQCSQFREVASQPRNLRVIPRNLRVIFGLAFEQELNSSLEFISSHREPFSLSRLSLHGPADTLKPASAREQRGSAALRLLTSGS